MRDPKALVVLLASLSAMACTPRAVTRPDLRLAPTERLLVMRAQDGQALDVVCNDNPAGDAFLHTRSLRIDPADPALSRLEQRMRVTLAREKGVGLAAPQVGINRRVILVQRLDRAGEPVVLYLNPEILHASEELLLDWEGCLSIPAGFGQVRRAKAISLRFQGAGGAWQEERVEGFTARIFQHEIDHLDGVLFIERKEPGPLVPKEEYRRRKQRRKRTETAPAAPEAERASS
ncbi:MAG: peptide deformylase [Deltaproteobacteria bacterium]|nr:peptide deformylase [Deltaproteobacteria bacterium]